jgi:hypothetical protein
MAFSLAVCNASDLHESAYDCGAAVEIALGETAVQALGYGVA